MGAQPAVTDLEQALTRPGTCSDERAMEPVTGSGQPSSRPRARAGVTADVDRYRVVSIPATDALFRHTVDRLVRSVRQHGVTLRGARGSLRRRYPDAKLSRQRDCYVQGEAVDLWFAYRDGRAEALAEQHVWWNDPGLARVVLHDSGRLTGPNAACRHLLDMAPGRAAAITLHDLVSAELLRDLWLESKRRPASEAWIGSLSLRLSGGRRLDIDFHVQPVPRQRFQVTMRSLADRDRANDWLALRRSALGSVSATVLRELLRNGLRRELGPGEHLASALTDDAWVVVVTAGIMRLYLAMDDSEPTLAFGSAGSMFGTHALGPSGASLLGLQAVTSGVVVQLSARRVGEMARSNPTFQRALSGDVQVLLREVIRSFAGHAAGDLRQRLAREIEVLSNLHPDVELLPVTEQQLADGIGSIRESIGRSIGDLRRDGSIATTRHGLLILDKRRLRTAGQLESDEMA